MFARRMFRTLINDAMVLLTVAPLAVIAVTFQFVPASVQAVTIAPPPPPPPPPPRANLYPRCVSICGTTTVMVAVANNGQATAVSGSLVTMEFLTTSGWQTRSARASEIPAGREVWVVINQPAGFVAINCGNSTPRLQYRVAVDATAQVPESNEQDNVKSTLCF